MPLSFTQAFSRYGAKLKNVQWAVSAETSEGEIAISLWQHKFEYIDGNGNFYRDYCSRFSGSGSDLLREHISKAFSLDLSIRAIVAIASDPNLVDSGADVSRMKKEFDVKPRWSGRLLEFDGDAFTIHFTSGIGS